MLDSIPGPSARERLQARLAEASDRYASLRKVSKLFRTSLVETAALHDVTLDIRRGEFLAVMGPSGCGKSTLLNIVALLDPPTSGAYLLDGTDVTRLDELRLGDIRKSTVGFVFQSFNLIDTLTVYQNVELPLLYRSVPRAERCARVRQALTRVNLEARMEHFPNQLSGGQQQRTAVARAIVGNPKLIVADEPTGNLDTRNGEEVMAILQDLHAAGSTLLMVTHSAAHAARAERVLHMLDGRIVREESPAAR